MGKVTIQWPVGEMSYQMMKTRSTISRGGRLTFKAQGPFDKTRRMVVTEDGDVLAVCDGSVEYDPESGGVLRGNTRWKKVGRYLDDQLHIRVAFIGPDDVPTYEEHRRRTFLKKQDDCKESGPGGCGTCLLHWTCPMAVIPQ